MIEDILRQIDEALKENYADVYDSLNPGADDNALNLLQEKCLGGGSLPSDLVLLYKWHNGQTGYFSLNQDDNRTFLPIDEVIDAWQFLNDPMEDILEPISKRWLPIAYNGAGDYLMYDLDDGTLLGYWHDDEDRSVENASLTEWLREVLDAAEL